MDSGPVRSLWRRDFLSTPWVPYLIRRNTGDLHAYSSLASPNFPSTADNVFASTTHSRPLPDGEEKREKRIPTAGFQPFKYSDGKDGTDSVVCPPQFHNRTNVPTVKELRGPNQRTRNALGLIYWIWNQGSAKVNLQDLSSSLGDRK